MSKHGRLSVDQAHLAKEKAKADAEYYKAEREAEANKVLYYNKPLGMELLLLEI